ncbi:hypothetical protein [Microbacterium sp. MPKO10]|uniref:hypothetical protein n=1 Tax=Microbacterium sp. MPKO10 TaxID=2989818 RepID=UPI0022360532|nr:hypothetical protein [Microbacterium sp. MPKO10]MCW4458599.1 hypothetical protein [Microbacterium sp. MPKO10]
MTEQNQWSNGTVRPTRRGVLTASAWAVPIIAVAAATPAAAASATSGFSITSFDAGIAAYPGADFLMRAYITTAAGDPAPAGTTISVYVSGTFVLYTNSNQDGYADLPLDYENFPRDTTFFIVLNERDGNAWTSQTYETNMILDKL